jgi:alkanesulfonate monooxygenase SsuD/methylene tetrahydromethanopterin reductase-like flavin-dependent oxidoreductase (luciferase family)
MLLVEERPMDVGILLVFQNYRGQGRDEDVVRHQMRIAELAEELGFAKLWCVEHHFTDYAACPDNLEFLAWVAARTRRLRLGTGAVIVPWNDPLRVAEKVSLLDHLSDGRAVLGLGRGLARREYAPFGIDMNESRDRFDEASRMIVDALDKGFLEGAGPYYPRMRTEIRPRPRRGFRDRFYCVGMSPDSVEQAARLGARLMIFSQQTWEMFRDGALAAYRASWRQHHGTEPPAPLCGDLMFCHADPARAEALAMQHMPNYFLTIIEHYEILSDHFKQAKGYEHYASASDLFKQVGLELAANTYCSVQTWGTPEQILAKLRARRELLGDFELSCIVDYGGLGWDEVEKSLRLFGAEVLPEVCAW